MNNWNDIRDSMANATELYRIPEGMELVKVVGLTFIPGYPENLLNLAMRGPVNSDNISVFLKRNPVNQYDSNAIEVHVDGNMVGHIPKDIAARIAPIMDTGVEYKSTLYQIRISYENHSNPGLDILVGEVKSA